MKKMIVGILAAALMTMGFVGASAAPSVAAKAAYPGTVRTHTLVVGLGASKPGQARVLVHVSSYGKGRVTGKLVFTIVRTSGRVYSFNRTYTGGNQRFTFNKIRSGKYNVAVNYIPSGSSKFKPSSGRSRLTVR